MAVLPTVVLWIGLFGKWCVVFCYCVIVGVVDINVVTLSFVGKGKND